ncbi:MAG: response regulator [Burkholderiales bacterium]|nr:MAG: response regulator [Burkholderiales bacterium]
MFLVPHDLHDAHALVIEGNPQSRSILISQLRDIGFGKVTQCSRMAEARRKLESSQFDVVICEQTFERETGSGQDLLDDLRRNQLLPFYTVFIMVTAEASYSKVAEAAEAALDAYLLKPHTGARLAERILQARSRKAELEDIFSAIDEQDFERAAHLCMERFEARGPYWLYAARIGAELLLRTGRLAEARTLYEAVVEAKTLPWARLGVARAQLGAGDARKAATTLDALLQDEPEYADAYDVMGRAQFELGNFENALATFKMATQLTPHSISRLLKHGMLSYYAGDRGEGIELLDRATRIGIDSKMYDPQALVLLAFARLDANDRKGMARVIEQLTRLKDRSFEPERPYRLLEFVRALEALLHEQETRVLDEVKHLTDAILEPWFDFEMATNLVGLLVRAVQRRLQVYEVEKNVEKLGLRFCTSRALTELLASAAAGNPLFATIIHEAHARVLKLTEQAMTMAIKGDPRGTVIRLLEDGQSTCNAKLIESSWQVLNRYAGRIEGADALREHIASVRESLQTQHQITRLGDAGSANAAPGGLALPSGYKPPRREGLLDRMRTD